MKILLVIPEFPPDFGGGIVSYGSALALALRAHGCAVSVLKGSAFVQGSASYTYEGIGVSTLKTELFRKWLDCFRHFSMFPELQRHLAASFALHEQAKEGEGFDAVEVTDWGFLFLPWTIHSQTRVLVQLHGSTGQILLHEPVAGREAERAISLLLEKVALTKGLGLSSYGGANARWWEEILGRPIDNLPPPLNFEPVHSVEKAPSDRWLSVGRIQHWKGPQVACAAWGLLGDRAPSLDWIGRDVVDGETGKSTSVWLRQQFPAVWGKRIHPVGQVTSAECLQRMRAAKAVVIPSLWDVYNLVAAEAMSLGKVVVISDGAGAVDLVENGVSGFVFPNGDAPALARLVQHVEALGKDELEKIGRAAAATVRERLNPASIAAEKLKLYSRLPDPKMNQNSWLRDWLLPAVSGNPLGFLDGLPLRDLSAYVMRRGAKRMARRAKP